MPGLTLRRTEEEERRIPFVILFYLILTDSSKSMRRITDFFVIFKCLLIFFEFSFPPTEEGKANFKAVVERGEKNKYREEKVINGDCDDNNAML